MDEQASTTVNTSRSQHAWRTRFHARLQRFRSLLVSKWWLPVLGVALGLGAESALWMLGKPTYASVGRMIVSMKLAIPEGSLYTEELSNFLGTQAALMQSMAVINRAHARVMAQDTNLVYQPVNLKVNILPKTTIFVLQASGEHPLYTQRFLQACMEEYVDFKKEMRTKTSDLTLVGLSDGVEKLSKEIKTADQELVEFQSTNSVLLLDQQGNSTLNYLVALNQRLAGLKSEYELLQSLSLVQNLERKEQGSSPLPSAEQLLSTSSGSVSANDPAQSDFFRANQQILLLKAQQEDWGQYLRPKHPRMMALAEEISRRERLLDIFIQQSGEQLTNYQASLVLQIQNLEKDVKAWDAKSMEISRQSAELQRLKGNSQRVQALYDRLLAMSQTLDLNKQISPESVTIHENASVAFPDTGKFLNKLLLGALAGLGLSILVLLVMDRLDDRMTSFTELQDIFDEEVLAQIPRGDAGAGQRGGLLIGQTGMPTAFVEGYRNLRSSLLYMTESGPRPKSLLITSSAPGEGKSMTAVNLAAMLANSGSRVLLVDADLRKGLLHSQFGLAAEPGLTEVLTQKEVLQNVIHPTSVPKLWLLPRGAVTHHSSELFVSAATESFLKEVAAQYDYVVVDTAPVMAADDVTSLAPHVDATLFVIRAEQTSARLAHAALELLYQRRVNVLGLVFNAVRPNSADYYYSKYHDYYRTYPAKS